MRKLWGATVIAVCLVVSGCVPGGGGSGESTTTSSASAEAAGNPWELPLEQRPPLFDPCAEIPVEALKEAGFVPTDKREKSADHEPGRLMACSWANQELLFGVAASWKSREDDIADSSQSLVGEHVVSGKRGEKLLVHSARAESTARVVFYTRRGAVVLSAIIVDALNRFEGKVVQDPYQVLDQVSESIVGYLPEVL